MKNIIFLLIDCLREDKLESIAKQLSSKFFGKVTAGIWWSNLYAVNSITTPCVTSIFTGLYPFTHRIRSLSGYKLNPRLDTLGKILSRQGYNCYAFVTGPLVRETGLFDGFQVFEYREKEQTLYSEWFEYMKKRILKIKEPYFVFIHLWELHLPRWLEPRFNADNYGKSRYERALFSLDNKLAEIFESIKLTDEILIIHGDHGEIERVRSAFVDKTVKSIGKNILGRKIIGLGSILNRRIRNASTKDRPISAGHGFSVKDSLLKVPFIVYDNNQRGIRVDDLCSQVDVMPTMLGLLGLEVPMNISGINLLDNIVNKELKKERTIYFEATGELVVKNRWLMGVRKNKWKLEIDSGRRKRLFNIVDDPNEDEEIQKMYPHFVTDLYNELKKIRYMGKKEMPTEVRMNKLEEEITEQKLKELGYL